MGWIGTVEVNWYMGLEPGETLRPNVSPSLGPASQFTSTVQSNQLACAIKESDYHVLAKKRPF